MSVPAAATRFSLFAATAATEIYTLSLHDALPIFDRVGFPRSRRDARMEQLSRGTQQKVALARALLTSPILDRKSTRLNSSHRCISYAVFCLKKKKHMQHSN